MMDRMVRGIQSMIGNTAVPRSAYSLVIGMVLVKRCMQLVLRPRVMLGAIMLGAVTQVPLMNLISQMGISQVVVAEMLRSPQTVLGGSNSRIVLDHAVAMRHSIVNAKVRSTLMNRLAVADR